MTPRQQAQPGSSTLNRRQVVSGAIGLGLAGPLLSHRASALAAQDGTPKAGGILKVALQSDPTALDPQLQSLTAIWHVVEQIYDGLTRIITPDLSVTGALAESWDISEDGLT